VTPVRWSPPAAPSRARQRTGTEPFPPLDLIPLPGKGPEDVVVDAEGRLVTGVVDGRILRVEPESEECEVLADTGGRPLGLEVLPDGRILVCDSHRGLLRLDPSTGRIESLVAEVGGVPLRFASNAVAARDGTVYFTDSSTRYGFEHYRGDLLEHSCTGRLLRLGTDGAVDVLLDGLAFANGVALAADESYVVVAETAAYRLTRLDLGTGTATPWAENLPGFPDNISRGPSGLIWVALPNPRDRRLDWLLPRAPWLRKVVWAVPEHLQPQPTRTVWVLGIDPAGDVVRDLQAPGERWAFATGVAEHDGRLYLGSIVESCIAVLDIR
jgi:sugar lactone lactonase YvrE